MQMVPVPGALAAGSAQWPYGFTQPGGRLRDSEGVLAFYDDRLIFHADSGADTAVAYKAITEIALKKVLLRPLVKLQLSVPTQPNVKFKFKLGPELAANAKYILSAVAGQSRAPALGSPKTSESPPRVSAWAGGTMTSVGRIDGRAEVESDGLVIRGIRKWSEQWPGQERQDLTEQTSILFPWSMIESADVPDVGKLRFTPAFATDYMVIMLQGLDDETRDAWLTYLRFHGVKVESED